MRSLLRTADLTASDLEVLLDLATSFSGSPHLRPTVLGDEMVVMYFTKPSTRTRLSFAAAVANLGGVPVTVGPQELQLGRGETIEDTARVISGYAAALAVRTYSDDDVRRLADAATIPVINALTDGHHPCQSLADLLTLRQRFGSVRGLRVAYVGDGNNVVHSLAEGCALAGAHFVAATPPGYEPDAAIMAGAARLADHAGGSVTVTNDPREAVRGADAVYTDVWLSMGDAVDERAARVAALSPFRVDAALMALASRDGVFMHCLPAHRGDEVTAEVIDGPTSVVFQQAANRLPTETAVLYALVRDVLSGHPTGAPDRPLATLP